MKGGREPVVRRRVEIIRYGKQPRRFYGAILCGFTAALLILFATTARAGIIATHFGSGTHGFRIFGLGGSGLILQLLLLTSLAAFDFAGLFLGARRLDQE